MAFCFKARFLFRAGKKTRSFWYRNWAAGGHSFEHTYFLEFSFPSKRTSKKLHPKPPQQKKHRKKNPAQKPPKTTEQKPVVCTYFFSQLVSSCCNPHLQAM